MRGEREGGIEPQEREQPGTLDVAMPTDVVVRAGGRGGVRARWA